MLPLYPTHTFVNNPCAHNSPQINLIWERHLFPTGTLTNAISFYRWRYWGSQRRMLQNPDSIPTHQTPEYELLSTFQHCLPLLGKEDKIRKQRERGQPSQRGTFQSVSESSLYSTQVLFFTLQFACNSLLNPLFFTICLWTECISRAA